jgi:aminoglycoside phosphotransferase (APT) family kinase protein
MHCHSRDHDRIDRRACGPDGTLPRADTLSEEDLATHAGMVVGEGLDNVAYEVAGELIVRLHRKPDPVRLRREARLLAVVAAVAPLPVPEPRFTVAERGCLAYPKLPGVPLLDLPRRQRAAHAPALAARLGEFLAALHAVPVARVTDLVDVDDAPPQEWRREAQATYSTVAARIPPRYRPAVEDFLAAPPPRGGYAPVFSHTDLGIEHVLVDPVGWTVTGIIDWSDAAVVDPACDFGRLHRDLGTRALRAALDRYPADPDDRAALSGRAAFYARCGVLEDLAYGVGTGRRRYVDKCLDALAWLFPGQPPEPA